MRIALPLLIGSLVAGGMAVLGTPTADGQGRLRANVYLTQHRIPRNLSERGLLGFARRHNARQLRETTAEPIPERKWRAEMITSFNRPPGDLEYHILWYDIEDGARRFVRDMSTFVSDRSQKTFVTRVNLPRGQGRAEGFQPNRRYELVVTIRRAEVGRSQVTLAGEEIARSGEVTFGEDER
ncbi:MAG: hypothetical protein AAGF12_00725 [Myxococcota bacterium]